jgi:hypothetical protein
MWLTGLLVVGALLAGQPANAQGMSSTNYSIPVAVINSGGGVMSSANYTLIASIGEPVIGASVSIRGDVNRDGLVNSADVSTVMRIAEGAKRATDADVDFGQADTDANAKIDLLDALTLGRRLGSGSGFRLDAGFLPAALQ